MVIGLDFDGVLTDLASFIYVEGERFARENNIPIKINEDGISSLEYYGWTDQDDINFWATNMLKYTKFVSPKKDVSRVLHKLKEKGHRLVIITARYYCDQDNEKGRETREISENWLKENDIPFDEIHYVGGASKVQTVLDCGIDVFVDDSIMNLEQISTVVPVVCFSEKYNKNYQNQNMKRISSWEEIFEYIEQLEGINENNEN